MLCEKRIPHLFVYHKVLNIPYYYCLKESYTLGENFCFQTNNQQQTKNKDVTINNIDERGGQKTWKQITLQNLNSR